MESNITLYKSISLALMYEYMCSSCRKRPEYPEETHLSELVTTTHADIGYQARVAAVRDEHVITYTCNSSKRMTFCQTINKTYNCCARRKLDDKFMYCVFIRCLTFLWKLHPPICHWPVLLFTRIRSNQFHTNVSHDCETFIWT